MSGLRIFRYAFFLISVLPASLDVLADGEDSLGWNKIVTPRFTLHYTNADKNSVSGFDNNLQSGIGYIIDFFAHPFQSKFDVFIFPGRNLLDRQWQKDWNDSTFQSQCWMIASGVAHRLDLLSTNAWTKEACEHDPNDSTGIRQVIWHELVHVFHGQYNPDHTFNYIDKLDWLVEGLATYVSGQLNERRLQRIKQMIAEDKIPGSLDNFWKGADKYGLSGSMVAYVDKTYGREKLFEILQFTNKHDVLRFLGVSETKLIADWKASLK